MGWSRRSQLLTVALIVTVALLASALPGADARTKKERHKAECRDAVKKNYDDWLSYWEKKQDDKDKKNLAESTKGRRTSEMSSPEGTLAVDGVMFMKKSKSKKKEKTIVVDKKGKADYKTIQAAIDSIKEGNKIRVVIKIKPGIYYEKILVPKKKNYITFLGSGQRITILSWGDTAGIANGTAKSASTAVEADYFIAKDLTFRNSAPAPTGGAVGRQAVAFRIKGDKGAFYRVSFYGAQDTLYDQYGRHYFEKCFIQGSIDFIFGDGQSLYKDCHLNSIANPYSGSLTAQKRSVPRSLTGYSFLNCRVTGTGPIYMGRAWGPYSRVVFIKTYFDDIILPVGWFDWGEASRRKTVYYGQYMCSGPGANTKRRASWSRELTSKEARPFSTISFIDGKEWL